VIVERLLSKPFDLASASVLRSIPAESNTPEDVVIADNGRKLFQVGTASNLIYGSDSVGPDFAPVGVF
jgi:hypothetical protein